MKTALTLAVLAVAPAAQAQNRIDLIRPDAPERAALGEYAVGVRTMAFTDAGRVDILSTQAEGEIPTYDRTLTVEVWYPAADGTEPGGTYTALLRDGTTEVALQGRAARDADPARGEFPLVIISHGYPGNRFLMSHLGENLASKGFVVAAADHPDSTYDDQGPFPSTLYNRPLDQAFLLNSMADLDDEIGAITDADRTGIVGYSMGGYGALIFGGGALSAEATTRTEPSFFVAPQGLLAQHAAGTDTLEALVDDRVKAIVAIGPWGRNRAFWDADSLRGFEKPLLLVAGSVDDVSEYPAMRQIFEETTGVTRYLLTFEGANHNAAAPMPAPAEAWVTEGLSPYDHYSDAVWDTVRMNNILQHFSTVFFQLHLEGFSAAADYLDLTQQAEDGVWDMGEDGEPNADHTYWRGFPNRTAVGLRLESRVAE